MPSVYSLQMTKVKKIGGEIYIWLMLFAFPLVFSPKGYADITKTKMVFFMVVTAVFALFRFICCLLDKRFPYPRSVAQWAVLVYLLATCLSALASPYEGTFMGLARNEGVLTVFFYCLTFFCGVGISFKRRHILPLALATVGFSLIGILQICNLNPLGLYPDVYYYYAAMDVYTAPFIGTIGNAGIAGAFLSVVIPLFFTWFITGKKRYDYLILIPLASAFFLLMFSDISGAKIGVAAAIVLCIVFMLTDKNRICRTLTAVAALIFGAAVSHYLVPIYNHPDFSFSFREDGMLIALLSLAALLSLGGWLLRKVNFSVNAKLLRAVMLITLVLVVTIGIIYIYNSDAQNGFIYELNQVMHGNLQDEFGSNRIRIWKRCIEMFKEYPLLGSGPDTGVMRFNIIFERFSPIWQRTLRTGVDTAHNEYLNLLVTVGIIGLVPFVVAIAAVLFKKKKPLREVCAIAVLGYVVQAFFLFSISITAPYFWLFLGLADKAPIKRKIRIDKTTSA